MTRRANALVLLDDGWSCRDVAKAFLLDDDTIRGWGKLFEQRGIEGLTSFDMGGSTGFLSAAQEDDLKQVSDNNTNSQRKVEYELPSIAIAGLLLLVVPTFAQSLFAQERAGSVVHKWDGDLVAACLVAETIESGVAQATLSRLRDAIICERSVAHYLGRHCPTNRDFFAAVHAVGQFRGQQSDMETTLARALSNCR